MRRKAESQNIWKKNENYLMKEIQDLINILTK